MEKTKLTSEEITVISPLIKEALTLAIKGSDKAGLIIIVFDDPKNESGFGDLFFNIPKLECFETMSLGNVKCWCIDLGL